MGIPVLAYIVYDVLRIFWNNRKAKADTVLDEKDAEIARLRALIEQQNGGAELVGAADGAAEEALAERAEELAEEAPAEETPADLAEGADDTTL